VIVARRGRGFKKFVVIMCNVEIQLFMFFFIFDYCILIAKDFIPQLAAYQFYPLNDRDLHTYQLKQLIG